MGNTTVEEAVDAIKAGVDAQYTIKAAADAVEVIVAATAGQQGRWISCLTSGFIRSGLISAVIFMSGVRNVGSSKRSAVSKWRWFKLAVVATMSGAATTL